MLYQLSYALEPHSQGSIVRRLRGTRPDSSKRAKHSPWGAVLSRGIRLLCAKIAAVRPGNYPVIRPKVTWVVTLKSQRDFIDLGSGPKYPQINCMADFAHVKSMAANTPSPGPDRDTMQESKTGFRWAHAAPK